MGYVDYEFSPFAREDSFAVLPWCGIYRVKNLENGKYYIGQTRKSFHERWKSEIKDAKYKGKYWSSLSKFEDILCTMADDTANKYIKISDTEAKFGHLHFKKLQEWHNMFTKKELNTHESRAIDFFDSCLNGYNGNWGPHPCFRAYLISVGQERLARSIDRPRTLTADTFR